VTDSARLHDRGSTVVYVIAALIVLSIGSAAVWTVMRDYRVAVDHAALHLDNVTVVLAEHTRFALQQAPVAIGQRIEAAPPGGGGDGLDGALQSYFHDLFRRVELAYRGRVVLFRPDGALVASYPALTKSALATYAGHPLFEHAKRFRSGSLEGPGVIEPGERLIGYRRIADYPVLVVVSTPMSSVLANWKRDSAIMVVGAVLFAALTAAAAFLLGRDWRLKTALMEGVAERQLRLDSIIGSAMDAVITVDENQNIVLFNAAAETIFRCAAKAAIGGPLSRFIPERFREAHEKHVRRFGEGGVTMRRMGGALVLSGLRSNGEEFPIDASISYATVSGKKFYTVILRDVTARERALQEQRRYQRHIEESERRLNSIIGSAMDAIITIDQRHNICLFNTAAEQIFGWRAEEMMHQPVDRLIPERFRPGHRAHVARFGESGTTMRRMGETMVLYGLRSSGEEFPIDASISHVTVAGEKFFTVILRDITERQRAAKELEHSHQQLRELYEAMHEVREGERTRIARELHDELAQWLTALKMDASWIASRLPREHEQLVTKAERMKGVVDNTVAAMRRIAADLRPVMLDDLGLVPAIENLLYDLSERAGIAVSLTGGLGDAELKEPYATAVYRMVQEALTNVARHSGAAAVEVHVAALDGQLRVRIEDNGRGFNPDPERKSFGVLGIRERARTLGGAARIFSPEGGGTVVEIEIPLMARTTELAQ
jgi:PAS domain S-box-containing protein